MIKKKNQLMEMFGLNRTQKIAKQVIPNMADVGEMDMEFDFFETLQKRKDKDDIREEFESW